jgi:septal ring factor EnvC (AmiA/AmiB activator)
LQYKTYIIVALICFALGYCLCLLSSRGQLQSIQIRADEYQKRIGEYTAGEAKFDSRLKQLQVELAASRSSADEYRKEVSRLRTEINNLSKPISEAGNGIDGAIEHAKGITNPVDRIERILSAVQKRGKN